MPDISPTNGVAKRTPGIPKGTACTECRKQKVKCERRPGQQQPCQRCQRGGIVCRVKRLVDASDSPDAKWRNEVNQKMVQIQAALTEVLQQHSLPPLSAYGRDDPAILTESTTVSIGGQAQSDVARAASIEPLQGREIISEPMSSVLDVTSRSCDLHGHTPLAPGYMQDDLVSRGQLPLPVATEMFKIFNEKMNQYLWGGIALVHGDLASVRRSSSLLCAAILAVACLHVPGKETLFDICYNEFVALVSKTSINLRNSLDDVRALVIGAFWLPDLSWKLSGLAVRIATELNLHQSFQQLLRGDNEKVAHVRLWYLLYVCDHHFSIAYGRPPMIHESYAIRSHEKFFSLGIHTSSDYRIVCQVALFICLTDAYHTFGIETNSPLEEADFGRLRNYNLQIENWRVQWQPRLAPNPHIKEYPAKGVILHYHFARLQLNSLAIRGLSPTPNLSMERIEAANVAIFSATAAISLLLREPDLRQGVVGMPLFKHTMITFSAVFLLKVAWKWSDFVNIDPAQVLGLVQEVVNLMKSVTVSRRHLVYHITNGLAESIEKFRKRMPPVASRPDLFPPNDIPPPHSQLTPDAQSADVFPDFIIGDGLDFDADGWLFPSSLDVFWTDQQPGPENVWNGTESVISSVPAMGSHWTTNTG